MRIAYLAPELTALSATFVYKEIIGLEEKRFRVLPFSVHSNRHKTEKNDLDQRVIAIYDKRFLSYLYSFFADLFTRHGDTRNSLNALFSDLTRVQTVRQKIKLIYQYLSGIWLSTKLRRERIDHLHIHFGHVPTQIGMYAALQYSCPFTFTVHANDLFQRPLLYPEKAKRAKAVITISEFNKLEIIRQGVPSKKIHVVRCGVKQSEFKFQPKTDLKEPYRLLAVARLVHKKGIDILIQAIKQLRESGINVTLDIVGNGPESEILESLVSSLNLNQFVCFKGSISNDQLPKCFSSKDIFVLPCRIDRNGDMDGIPVVLLEAMSYGIPVISTSISGIPELIKNEETGLLVRADNVNELSSAVKNIIESQSLRRTIVHNAKELVTDEFSFEKNLEKLIKVFVTESI